MKNNMILVKSAPLNKIFNYPVRLFENLNTGEYELYYSTYYAGKYDDLKTAKIAFRELLQELYELENHKDQINDAQSY